MSAFESAIRKLLELRRSRLAVAPSAEREVEITDLARELQALEASSPQDRAAAGEAWDELVSIFGSDAEAWAQYPSAAGLVLGLKSPQVRVSVVEVARMTKD